MDMNGTSTQRLSHANLVLAVEQCIHEGRSGPETTAALHRENPEEVQHLFDSIISEKYGPSEPGQLARHGLLATKMRALHRPVPYRLRTGLTLTEMAGKASMARETLCALLEHHGYIETSYFGGQQRRCLVTDQAFQAELGHNVDCSRSRCFLEGQGKVAVFPVFYEDHFNDIMFTLDHPGIVRTAKEQGKRKAKMAWLMANYDFLPDKEIAEISGYSLIAVKKARAELRRQVENEVAKKPPCSYHLREYALELGKTKEPLALAA